MKYFRQTEWDIKWKMTWENYMLYISSIPRYESDEDGGKQAGMKEMNIENWC